MDTSVRDVVIIGSGPAGWTAATYAARAGLAPLVITGVEQPGGALTTTTEVENFPGFPAGVAGPTLMADMQAQAVRFGAEVEFDQVASVELTGDLKTIVPEYGDEPIQARTVIVSTGSAYLHLGAPGEERLGGRGVSYCATCDGAFFSGSTVVVVGGGDSACEEALFLTRFADQVILVHRRAELRASKVMAERVLSHKKIRPMLEHQVTDICGQDKVAGVVCTPATGPDVLVPAQGVFIAIGSSPRTSLFAGQAALDGAGHLRVEHPSTRLLDASGTRALPGVFAAGDVVDPVYRQAIVAAGEGAKAALDAQGYLDEISGT
ncbi:NAD(P)/FAD-dependent oxidoreductase [Oerskovia sp. NPDC060338]|uniref:NAD(P)/FAD-dependent oxidoreductase n=1 Tax=Oerskovia sp. NPDC060338 TaxID=3347100 RepID=UPI003646B683